MGKTGESEARPRGVRKEVFGLGERNMTLIGRPAFILMVNTNRIAFYVTMTGGPTMS